jgi:hypothetical protein
MGCYLPVGSVYQLLCQVDGITFHYQVKVEVGSLKKQITNHPTDKVKALPFTGSNQPGRLHKLNQLGG